MTDIDIERLRARVEWRNPYFDTYHYKGCIYDHPWCAVHALIKRLEIAESDSRGLEAVHGWLGDTLIALNIDASECHGDDEHFDAIIKRVRELEGKLEKAEAQRDQYKSALQRIKDGREVDRGDGDSEWSELSSWDSYLIASEAIEEVNFMNNRDGGPAYPGEYETHDRINWLEEQNQILKQYDPCVVQGHMPDPAGKCWRCGGYPSQELLVTTDSPTIIRGPE